MDGDTVKERLDYLESKIEDWHALQTFLMVIVVVAAVMCVLGRDCGFKT